MKKKAAEPLLDENGRAPLKLDYGQTFKVGFAFAIIMLFWQAYDFVIPLLLEKAFGLPNSLRGLIMGLDNLLSLFLLPVFGKLSDNAHGKIAKRFGRRTPFIVVGTLASVILMVFVPVSTRWQYEKTDKYSQAFESNLSVVYDELSPEQKNSYKISNPDGSKTLLSNLLGEWYDNAENNVRGSKNYCDLKYLKSNGITKDYFVTIQKDPNFSSKKEVLNMVGKDIFYYDIPVYEYDFAGSTLTEQEKDVHMSGKQPLYAIAMHIDGENRTYLELNGAPVYVNAIDGIIEKAVQSEGAAPTPVIDETTGYYIYNVPMDGSEYLYNFVRNEDATYKYSVATAKVDGSKTEIKSGRVYSEIKTMNDDYSKYVETGVNNYKSDLIYKHLTKTKQGGGVLAAYMVILLLVLIAMSSFRSPAVALMPDVTPKPLRSQANAVINLCGGLGGAVGFLIYTIAFFSPTYNTYVIIFGSVAAGMLLLLGGLLAFVNERKMVAKCQELCKEYGIDDFEEGEKASVENFAEELIREGDENYALDEAKTEEAQETVLDETPAEESATPALDASSTEEPEAATLDETSPEEVAHDQAEPEAKEEVKEVAASEPKKKHATPKDWWNGKTKEERSKLVSFWLILASIFMWFMGYNAISSNLSIYTTKALNLDPSIASIISGVSMGVSAIAFIPVGYLAAKIGRRKSIIIGFGLAIISFVLIFAFVRPSDEAAVPAALFAVFYVISGFGLIIANVNTFPMVTELSTAQTVGQYTGYYYMATMSAQAITPFIGGLVMDYIKNEGLFLYSAICIAIAIVLMVFVKHGDSGIIGKGRKLTKEEKRQIRLDALDAD